jgi:uncharacterized protein (DUF488 family)
METTLYTLGHSTHTLAHVLALLTQHGVTAIADVRSLPYSRRHPQFNRDRLKDALAQHHIAYVHLSELGARPTDPTCYVAGQVQYARLAATAAFQRGLTRIQHGRQRYRIALLCAEQDPLACHRTILICRALRTPGMAITHILADGRLEHHEASEQRLVQLVGATSGDRHPLERAYDLQGQRIAYRT